MLGFGVLGWLMKRYDWSAAPMILGLVLGPIFENALRQSLTLSHGSGAIFVTRPISAVLLVLALIAVTAPLWTRISSVPKLFDRIGVDINQKLPLEAAVEWTLKHKVPVHRSVPRPDAGVAAKRLSAADARREPNWKRPASGSACTRCPRSTSPRPRPSSSKAADDYLAAYIDAAERLGAGWIVVHGGYHFGSDKKPRMDAAVARIARAAEAGGKEQGQAAAREPEPGAEGRRGALPVPDLDECRYYFDRLDSPALGWSFTVNHAHIQPNSIDAFMKGLDMKRCGEVRLADCRGTHEEHLQAGRRHDRFSRHVRRDREERIPRALHAGVSAASTTC